MTEGIRTFNEVFDVTLSVDTNAYAVNDVLAAPQEITNVFPDGSVEAIIQSVRVLDIDDQGKDFDLIFLDQNVDLGDENGAYSATDAAAKHILAVVQFTSYIDLLNHQIAQSVYGGGDEGSGVLMKPLGNSTSLWIGAVCREVATYASGTIFLKIGLLRG